MDSKSPSLTEAQRQAVTHIDGPLLILAGPGSGKTRVVTHRIAHMLSQGVQPWQIAALTFTNKAADEMRERVDALVSGQPVWMGTFHRFCAQLLRRHADMVGLSENYSIYDSSDSKQAMKRAIEAANVSTSQTSPEKIAAAISRAKNRLATPEMLSESAFSPADTLAARVYPVYQQQLLTANAVDFDDLLLHIATLLRENSEMRRELDKKFKYILVDEYQDTNLAQYSIVRALSIDHPNLAVTGDPDQSIYGWRGADVKNILDFEKDYPSVKTVRLEKNYRSTPNILRAADTLIRHNQNRKPKDLYTDHPEGDPVVLRIFQDGYKEADGIADEIASLVAGEGFQLSDFAVFCRMNALTRSLEHAFRSRALPYQIVNGVEFYQRREIKDLLAYLHLINNPNHDVALQRVINTPTRGIGAKTVEKLREHANYHRIPMLEAARHADAIDGLAKRAKTMIGKFVSLYDHLAVKSTATLEDLIRYLVEETKFEAYLEKTAVEQQDATPMANVDEFITAAVEFDRMHPDDGSLDAFLEQVALVADTDAMDGSTDRVTVMTLHAAKGLEFPCVYIIGVEEDLLPHSRSKNTQSELEEERRLLFVGITRAKQRLQLSVCKSRPMRGDMRPAVPSSFLNELPLDEIKRVENTFKSDFYDEEFDQSYPDDWDLPEINVDDASQDLDDSDNADSGSANEGKSKNDMGGADYVSESPALVNVMDETSQVAAPPPPPRKPPQKPKKGLAGLQTAADFLSNKRPPIGAFEKGVSVRHDEHGIGEVVSATGRGPKRIVKVRFDDGEHSFRLAFAKLELVDG